MMRVAFLLLLSFCFVKAEAQLPWKYPGAGIQMKKMVADSVADIPRDTLYSKIGVAIKGNTLFVGNGVKWTEVASGSGIDTVIADIFALQQALEDTAANILADIPLQSNQLLFRCEVLAINDSLFSVSAASYRLSGVSYSSNDTILEIGHRGDSSRIDLFYVDTSGRALVRAGAEAANPVPPAFNSSI